jgi:2,4-dienoyl-CoA reductase-like NADH-dependent reductase (Old Yellow Enzyme family)/thioredoxin reductase
MVNIPFPLLFSPISINSLTLKNRIVMPPMCTAYATIGGAVTDRIVSYYTERAKGGVGLIDVEYTYVAWEGKIHEHMLGIYDDRLIPGLKRLTDAVHAAGAKVAIQLSHGGKRARSDVIGSLPCAPSPIPSPAGEMPRELTLAEIEEIIDAFISAAGRAKKAGFNAIMLHMAHGYLIHQFLSPYTNRRSDGYGGDLDGRARLALEILRGVRQEVGKDFPITCRFCGDEYLKGGIDQKMAIEIAKLLEANGMDAIEVSFGSPDSTQPSGPRPPNVPMGFLADVSHAIKKVVSIPVGVVGRIHHPRVAEAILQERKADLIAVGRGLIADPYWPQKALDGRTGEICPCISCNEGCADRMYNQLDVSCTVNPSVGRESSTCIEIAKRRKNVLILGGGPAGLEAARIAALRGHKVHLCEKKKELGGQLRISSAPPGKEVLEELRQFLIREITRLGVEISYKSIDRNGIKKLSPHEIVVAVGGTPKPLDVRGIRNGGVSSAWEVLLGKKPVGKRVAIIGGGGVGLETGVFLLEEGREITILEMLNQPGQDMGPRTRRIVLTKLVQHGVEIITQSRVVAIEKNCIVFNRGGLMERTEGFDSIIIAVGTISQHSGIRGLEKMGFPIRFIGDCLNPRKLIDAIHEGFFAGIEI